MRETEFQRLGRFVLENRFSPDQIAGRQREVFQGTLSLSSSLDGENFTQIHATDLRRMCLLYDDLFFDGRLIGLARREGIEFHLSKRMTRAAGKTVTTFETAKHDPHVPGGRKRRFEIVLSTALLYQTFHDVQRDIVVSGVRCHNRLEAAQRVCEHELVHLAEMLCFADSSCSRRQFQGIARRFFGHTDYQHQLITQQERAAKRFRVGVGSPVEFVFEGRVYRGRVNRITRRATVLVPDRQGQLFDDGQRYQRFYVPLERLKLTSCVINA